VSADTLDDPVTLRLSPGPQPGTTLRVRGRGVPAAGKHAAGDLLVSVNVVVPTDLSREARGLVERLATALGSDDA
jgi:molecular chaperone DnaJ